jgi:hypothetical protein
MAHTGSLIYFWDFRTGSRRCSITGVGISDGYGLNSTISPEGLTVSATGQTTYCATFPIRQKVNTPITIVASYSRSAGTVDMALMSAAWNGVYFQSNAARSSSSSDFTGNATPTADAVRPGYLPVYALTMSAANDLRCSANGGVVAHDTSCTLPVFGATGRLVIGGDYDFANRSDVVVAFVAIFNRSFSSAALQRISRDPDAYLYPRRNTRYWLSEVAAPAVPTLSASTYVSGSLTSTGWRPQVTAS